MHYEFELLKEQVSQGLAAKDRIYSIYANADSVAAARNWQAFYGNTPGTMRSYLKAGMDLGIYVAGTTIYFPRKWAGATFRILVTHWSSATFTPVNNTNGLMVAMSSIQQPADMMVGNTAWAGSVWTNLPFSGTANEWVSGATALVKLDDIVNVPYASMDTTTIGFLCTANTGKLRMEFEIVPASWYELKN